MIRKPKDFYAGLLFLLVGILVLSIARRYSLGAASNMGPGYFPAALAILLMVLGGVLVIRSFWGAREGMESPSLRPTVLILGGSLMFGLLIRPAGLIISVLVMVLIAAMASRRISLMAAVLLSAGLAVGSTLVFVYLLGQPIPVLGDIWND